MRQQKGGRMTGGRMISLGQRGLKLYYPGPEGKEKDCRRSRKKEKGESSKGEKKLRSTRNCLSKTAKKQKEVGRVAVKKAQNKAGNWW